MQSSYKRSESFITQAVPALLTLVTALLSVVPFRILGYTELTPAFTLMSVFYWCVYWPGSLPYTFLFVLGLLQDALTGMPMGMSSLLLVLLAYIIDTQRRLMGRAVFGTVWGTFALMAALTTMAQWSIMCLYYSKTYDHMLPFTRWVASCITYPLMHLLLTYIYKHLRVK